MMTNISPELQMLFVLVLVIVTIIAWFTITDTKKKKKSEQEELEKTYAELQQYLDQVKAAKTEEEINQVAKKLFAYHANRVSGNIGLTSMLCDIEEMLVLKHKLIVTDNTIDKINLIQNKKEE